jgi:hypothetical protein
MPLIAADAALPIADGLRLPATHRERLRPGELVRAADGAVHRLPRYFYEVESWALALATPLAAHFALWEFMDVDVREPAILRTFPRYIPCAVSLLAAALEIVRADVNAPVRIAANGGYRSPAYGAPGAASPHCWATAANIYRIGPDLVDAPERLERHAAAIRRLLPFAYVRPFGHEPGTVNDQLHVDLGYVTLVPHGAPEGDR